MSLELIIQHHSLICRQTVYDMTSQGPDHFTGHHQFAAHPQAESRLAPELMQWFKVCSTAHNAPDTPSLTAVSQVSAGKLQHTAALKGFW